MEKVTSRVRDIVGQRPSRRFIGYSTRVDGLWCYILVDGQAFQPVVTPYLSYTIYPSAGATLKSCILCVTHRAESLLFFWI